MGKSLEVVIDERNVNAVYRPWLDSQARTQILFGGSSSGKSVFLAQRTIVDLLQGGRNYLVCRQVGRTLRNSVFNELLAVVSAWGLDKQFRINRSEMVLTAVNGYQAILAGLDDVEKLKSIRPSTGVITDVWVEEATEADRNTVKQLYRRQRGLMAGDARKRLTMSFNPILKSHWIYDDYFAKLGWADDQTEYDDGHLAILKTTYKDNAFLTDADRRDLEVETDPYFYNVYSLGNWGVLGNVIFTNWTVQDLGPLADQLPYTYNGLDFGFSSDPAACVRTAYDRRKQTLYVLGELYEQGLTNDLLAVGIQELCGRERVVCDSSEPKSIAELQNYGVEAQPALKGRDSIQFGIQWLRQQRIVVDKSCINMQNELSQYKWREDRYGRPLPQPVDKHNHLIDALRYAYEEESMGGGLDVY